MTTRTRKAAPALDLAAYGEQLDRFAAQVNEATYRQMAGLADEMGLEAIYAEHAGLFEPRAIERLRRAASGDGDEAPQARALLWFALDQHLASAVAGLSERISTAESTAIVMWRGERIPYRAVWNRAADMPHRAERNALAASYYEAVEAINPLRQERLARAVAAVQALGYRDVPDMVAQVGGFEPQALAAQQRAFLLDSETVYFAALRRYLAELDIEQGDASRVDLARILRGGGWDGWFPARGMLPALRGTLAGLGIDLDAQAAIQLDVEHRDRKSPRAFCAPVRVPDDIRLVIQPRGGWDDYAAVMHQAGHAEHFAHVAPDLPVAFRRAGDDSLTEGYGALFELLVGEPAWLTEQVGMPEGEALAFADFNAFWQLAQMRSQAAGLIYQLDLHAGTDPAIAREQYAGMVETSLGVIAASENYLAETDDNLYVARYIRAMMLQGSLSAWLQANHGAAWWRSPQAGDTLRRSWSRGQEWNAQDVVAHLGYDRLDWRPVLRQIRTQLIGEMSGYGGPNITTRAGTRKV
ncbi:MAG TPA: hypothetical protein VHK63_10010 [Candidatus Limnocylindria bacterium]|nr:hypothetical protein [Candidatus Limnocylindria bacterium]